MTSCAYPELHMKDGVLDTYIPASPLFVPERCRNIKEQAFELGLKILYGSPCIFGRIVALKTFTYVEHSDIEVVELATLLLVAALPSRHLFHDFGFQPRFDFDRHVLLVASEPF